MAKYKAFLNAVTIITKGSKVEKGVVKDEFNDFVNKMGDDALSLQVLKGNRTKVGVMLWNHSKVVRRDDFMISIFLDRKRTTELTAPKGLVNLQKLALKYPGLQIRRLGVIETPRRFYKKNKEGKGYKELSKLETARADNPLNIAIISYKNKDEMKELFNTFSSDAGETKKTNFVINKKPINQFLNKKIRELNDLYKEGKIDEKQYYDQLNNIHFDTSDETTIGYKVNLDPHSGEKRFTELGLISFNESKEDPLISVILWHHERFGRDDYWIIILINDEVGTEIKEESTKTIAVKTGVPLLEWGRFNVKTGGEEGVRKEIEAKAKAFRFLAYNNIANTIKALFYQKKLKDLKEDVINSFEKIKNSSFMNIKGASEALEIFKEEEVLGNALKQTQKDYKDFDKDELRREYERVSSFLQDYGLTMPKLPESA